MTWTRSLVVAGKLKIAQTLERGRPPCLGVPAFSCRTFRKGCRGVFMHVDTPETTQRVRDTGSELTRVLFLGCCSGPDHKSSQGQSNRKLEPLVPDSGIHTAACPRKLGMRAHRLVLAG